jgi:hypothetical protein
MGCFMLHVSLVYLFLWVNDYGAHVVVIRGVQRKFMVGSILFLLLLMCSLHLITFYWLDQVVVCDKLIQGKSGYFFLLDC